MPAQMCKLRITLIEIALHRTYKNYFDLVESPSFFFFSEVVSSTLVKAEIMIKVIQLQMWKDFEIWCKKRFAIQMGFIKSELVYRCVIYELASLYANFDSICPTRMAKRFSTSNVKNFSHLQIDIFYYFDIVEEMPSDDVLALTYLTESRTMDTQWLNS